MLGFRVERRFPQIRGTFKVGYGGGFYTRV